MNSLWAKALGRCSVRPQSPRPRWPEPAGSLATRAVLLYTTYYILYSIYYILHIIYYISYTIYIYIYIYLFILLYYIILYTILYINRPKTSLTRISQEATGRDSTHGRPQASPAMSQAPFLAEPPESVSPVDTAAVSSTRSWCWGPC